MGLWRMVYNWLMIIREKPKNYKVIAVGLMILVAGFLIGWLVVQQASPKKPAEPTEAPETAIQTASETTEKMIELPNTTAIRPMEGDYATDSHLWRLVNKSHPLNDLQYRPENLQLATVASRGDKSTDERSIRADIMPAVEQLFTAAKEAGFDLEIGSGFRGYDLQNIYYTNYVNAYGQAAADSFSAKPGYSEHQTGLVVDLATTDHHCYLDECFGETAAGKWLAANAHLHGFILRYPTGKEGTIDFAYEPWHFRYVGQDLAKALFESGLTLDEAAPYLAKAIQS